MNTAKINVYPFIDQARHINVWSKVHRQTRLPSPTQKKTTEKSPFYTQINDGHTTGITRVSPTCTNDATDLPSCTFDSRSWCSFQHNYMSDGSSLQWVIGQAQHKMPLLSSLQELANTRGNNHHKGTMSHRRQALHDITFPNIDLGLVIHGMNDRLHWTVDRIHWIYQLVAIYVWWSTKSRHFEDIFKIKSLTDR